MMRDSAKNMFLCLLFLWLTLACQINAQGGDSDPPSSQSHTLAFSNVEATKMTVDWAIGNGNNRAVFIKESGSGSAIPSDSTSYTANTEFRQGTQIGLTGWYCVYNGPGASATVTGLMPDSTYRIMVCEYNGTPGNEKYLRVIAPDNPANQTLEKILINEVDVDTPGSDKAEFIELYDGGTGNVSLDGLVVVFYNGSTDKSYSAYDLDSLTTDAGGYFVFGNAAVTGVDKVFPNGKMQNGADAVALYVDNDSDFPNGTALTTTSLVDALVYDTGDADDSELLVLISSGGQIDEKGKGNSDSHSNQRIPNGSGGQRNTSNYDQLTPTPGRSNDTNPESADNSIEVDEDNQYVFTESDFPFNDTNGDTFGGIEIVSVENDGDLEYNTTDVAGNTEYADVTKLVFIPDFNDYGTPYATFTFKVKDSSGELSLDSYTMTINVFGVNDAPILNNIESVPLSFIENDSPAVVTSKLKVKDADDINMYGATISITRNYQPGEDLLSFNDTSNIFGSWDETTGTLTLTGIASRLTYQRNLREVIYKNTKTDDPTTLTRILTFRVRDENLRSNKVSREISVKAVNDPPVLERIEQSALTFIEGDLPLRLTDSVSVTDFDNTNIQSATIQIAENYNYGEDVLNFNNTGNITGNYNAVDGSLTLTGSDTKENYQSLLRSIEYLNTNTYDPNTLIRTLTFQVRDDNDTSSTAIRKISITSVNDPPVLEGFEQNALNFIEGDPPLQIAGSVYVLDVDNTNIQSASIQIAENYNYGEDVLSFNAAGNISGNFNADNGTLTLTGSESKENYQNTLRSVEYINTNTNNPATLTRTISLLLNDGESESVLQTRNIDVSAVNDPPEIDTSDVDTTPLMEGNDSLKIPLAINDEFEDSLKFSAESSCDSIYAEIVFNSPASLLIVPLFNADISATVIVIVSDGVFADTLIFYVEITEHNYSPTLVGLNNYAVNEGGQFDNICLDDFVNDENDNNNELIWTITGNTDLIINITDSRVLSVGIPDSEWFGEETITVKVEDPDGLADSVPVTFTIIAVNDPPVIAELPQLNFNEDDTLNIILEEWQSYISDAETPANELMYYFSNGNDISFELIGPVSGLNLFAPQNWFGADTLNFIVSDEDTTVSREVIISVLSVNDLPFFTDLPDTIIGDGDTTLFNLWKYTNDIETSDENFNCEFSGYDEDVLGIEYNRDNGNISLSVNHGFNDAVSFNLTVIDEDGGEASAEMNYKSPLTTGLGELALQIPDKYLLEQNYPNPFNPSTTIRFGLPSESNVNIAVYNLLGELIASLVDEVKPVGYYEYHWNASGLASGVYIYSVYAESTDRSARFSQVKKMILLR